MKAALAAIPDEKKGILLFCLAIFVFSLMDIVAKVMTARYPPMEVAWARYASQFFWSALILSPRLRSYLRTRHMGLQMIRSTCLFGATLFFFTSLKYLGLAEATAIFEVAPLMITVLSVVLLKEVVGIRRWGGVIAGLIGALIIIRPGAEVFQVAAIYPVGAAICFAGYAIATRRLGNDEPAATSFIYTTLIGTIVASLIVPFFWVTPTATDMAILGTFGMIGAAGHFMLIIALTYSQASVIAPFSYMALLWNALWGVLFFAEFPDSYTLVGALVIVGAGLYVWHRENRAK